jgi:hypothetical protein
MYMTGIILVEVVENPVKICAILYRQMSSHVFLCQSTLDVLTYHICEKPSNPSSACSGFVKTELKRVSLPWLFTQMPGWRGVPFFSGNQVDITPIGLREILSSGMLVDIKEELQLWHCQESSIFCIRSISF